MIAKTVFVSLTHSIT